MTRHHYVTGFDERFFLQYAVLAQTLWLREPDARLYVCDFGLSDAMCDYFQRQGRLLRWDGARKGMSAFTFKANLIEFVAPLTSRPLVWIDADAFPTADIGQAIERDHRGLAVWSTPDLGMTSIQQFIDKYGAPSFLERCRQCGIDTGRTYLNSGFFIVNDPFFLRRWQEEAAQMPPREVLFEQNAFNIAAYLYGNVGVLADGMWNLHGLDLTRLRCGLGPEGGLLAHCRELPVRVVHATSERESYHQKLPVEVTSAKGALSWPVKLLKDPTVRNFQLKMAQDYVARHRQELEASGIL